MGKPRKHKRKGPKSTRAGCLLCKPYKVNGVVDKRFTEPPAASKVHKKSATPKPKKEYRVEILWFGVRGWTQKKRFLKLDGALQSFEKAVASGEAHRFQRWGELEVKLYYNDVLIKSWSRENDC